MSLALSACSAPSPTAGPAAPVKSHTQAAQLPERGSTASGKLNMDEIFPPGPGRDLALNSCTSCHNITPIVTLQMTKDAWTRNATEHRERVIALSDADFAALYEYLVANFNPDRPVPQLPQELLEQWTSY
jgi:hypothetical protein